MRQATDKPAGFAANTNNRLSPSLKSLIGRDWVFTLEERKHSHDSLGI
jgi:hypothetical protein